MLCGATSLSTIVMMAVYGCKRTPIWEEGGLPKAVPKDVLDIPRIMLTITLASGGIGFRLRQYLKYCLHSLG